MLRTTFGLSRPVLKWVSQVTASLGATLAATLIWSAVPHPGAAPAPRAELTTGGKFAARAIQPVAYDGLDTMPLPHVSAEPTRVVSAPAEAVPAALLRRAAWEEAWPLAPPQDRIARVARPTHPPLRAGVRHVEPAPPAAVASEPVRTAEASAPQAQADEGFLRRVIPSALPHILPGIVSTAREAWSATASAGDTLVSRVVPGLP